MSARTKASLSTVETFLPSISEQRLVLKGETLTSPTIWRVLVCAHDGSGEMDAVACLLRALANLGHATLLLDWQRLELCDDIPEHVDSYGPHFISLDRIQPYLDELHPQLIVCVNGRTCFRKEDAERLKERGHALLGLTLSDTDIQESMIDHIGQFDLYGTSSLSAFEQYQARGIDNTVLFPAGVDRGYVCASVPAAPELAADVICLDNADSCRGCRETMTLLMDRMANVRVYGEGWNRTDVGRVAGIRRIQAMRAGKVHVNFCRAANGSTNIGQELFESIGNGAILATERVDEVARYFDYDTQIVGYSGAEDLLEQLHALLDDPARMESMRRASFARLAAEHTYEHRWLAFFQELDERAIGARSGMSTERKEQLGRILKGTNRRVRRIVVSGFYGAGNAGDELILRAISEHLGAPKTSNHLVVSAYDANAVKKIHRIAAFQRTDLPRAQSESASATAFILGGGGLWHDYTFVGAGAMLGLFTDNLSAVTGYSKLPLLARIYGRPLHVFGMGVGPMTDPDAKAYTRFLARQAESLTVRDAASKALLESIDGWDVEVGVHADPVFALDLSSVSVPQSVASRTAGRRVLGVNLRPWHQQDDDFLDRISEALAEIAGEYECFLLGIPFQSPEDTDVLEKVFAKIPDSVSRYIVDLTRETDPIMVAGAISACDALLAMRFHASLLALRLSVPPVGLVYDPKVAALFDQVDKPELALGLGVSSSEVSSALAKVLDDPSVCRDSFKGHVAELERDARASFDELLHRLDQAPTVTTPLVAGASPSPSQEREALRIDLDAAKHRAAVDLAEQERQSGEAYADLEKKCAVRYADLEKQCAADRADLEKQCAARYADLEKRCAARYADLEKQCAAELAEIEKQSAAELAEIEKQNAEKHVELEQHSSRQKADLNRRSALLEEENRMLRAAYNEIIHSKSWFVTKPLRWSVRKAGLARLKLREYWNRMRPPRQKLILTPEAKPDVARRPKVEVESTNRPAQPSRLRIAAIMDTFTLSCFEPECDVVTFRPDNWEKVLSEESPDFLFVESAWNGNDGAWQYRIAEYAAPPGRELPELVAWCKAHGIPTLFWNKEDPPHFNQFISSAKLFDVIFTSDADCIPKYQRHCGHDRVYALPFAAQPKIHNPVLTEPRNRKLCFAGTYYSDRFDARKQGMNILIRPALEYDFDIYDRMYGAVGPGTEAYRFPKEYQSHIVGRLPYDQMVLAYKRYRVFLNVNSVSQSPTMFSRRVFELLACGTPVVSTDSEGIRRMFSDIVALTNSVDESKQAFERLMSDDEQWRRLSARGVRSVMSTHTYRHRLHDICSRLGVKIDGDRPSNVVVVLIPGADPDRLAGQLAVQRQAPRLVLIPHGERAEALADAVRARIDGVSLEISANIASRCLADDDSLVFVMDGRNTYGRGYLLDGVLALGYAGVDFVGMAEHFRVEVEEPVIDAGLGHAGFLTNKLIGSTIGCRAGALTAELLMRLLSDEIVELPVAGFARAPFEYLHGVVIDADDPRMASIELEEDTADARGN